VRAERTLLHVHFVHSFPLPEQDTGHAAYNNKPYVKYQSPYQTADVTSHTVDTAAHDAHAVVL